MYSDGYRQRYSAILDMIVRIESEWDEEYEEEDRPDVLSTNLRVIREHLRVHTDEYGEETYRGVFKLSDHVDIEINRYRHQTNLYRGLSITSDSVDDLSEKLDGTRQGIDVLLDEVDRAQKSTERLQMQMVAILGIFAAIVMAFSGGLDILGGAISVSGESDLFRVVFVVLLCGIILFNIFAFLMHMILVIIRSQDRPRYRPYKRVSGGASGRLSTWLDRFTGSRFIIGFNSVLLIAMIVDAACMVLIGRRDADVVPGPQGDAEQQWSGGIKLMPNPHPLRAYLLSPIEGR